MNLRIVFDNGYCIVSNETFDLLKEESRFILCIRHRYGN